MIRCRSLETLPAIASKRSESSPNSWAKRGDGGLRGGRDLVSLDFAQVGRFDADALSNLAHREGAVLAEPFFAGCADILTKCHVYYIVHTIRRFVKRVNGAVWKLSLRYD